MENLPPTPATSCPLTPLTFLDRAAVVYGDSPSIIYNGKIQNWSETHSRCLRLASSIVSLGIPAGAIVSVVAPNILATYELQFAIPMAGCIINNINTRLDAKTIGVILAHSGSTAVFVDAHHREDVLKAISSLPRRPILIHISDDGENEEELNMSEFKETYEGMVEKGNPEFEWIRPKSEWEPMTLNYTSGTTSSPKGVLHCHRSLFVMAFDSLINWSVPKQPVYLWTLPMFHSNGWSYTWGMAAVGGTNVCLRRFDAQIIYDSIEKFGVTHMGGAPVVLTMLVNYKHRPDRLKASVQFLTGGAPPPSAVVHGAAAIGFQISHGYGLTEVGGVVVSCAWKSKWDSFPAEERARLKARQGVRTLGVTAADVVDPETGKSVPRDGVAVGEIVIKGACVMLGYLKNPKATAEALRDGWLFTGDVGVMHPDGYMEIKDRSKDIIISGGENVSSVEVESILYSNPAVNEAAVVARPDDYWGETPCAFLSLKEEVKPKPPRENEVIEYCRKRLPHYMVPKTVVFMAELPKTATGKVQKHALRDIATKMGTLATASRL